MIIITWKSIWYWDWRWHWFWGPALLVSVKLIFGRLSFFRFNEWALNLYNYSMSFTRSYEGKATIWRIIRGDSVCFITEFQRWLFVEVFLMNQFVKQLLNHHELVDFWLLFFSQSQGHDLWKIRLTICQWVTSLLVQIIWISFIDLWNSLLVIYQRLINAKSLSSVHTDCMTQYVYVDIVFVCLRASRVRIRRVV